MIVIAFMGGGWGHDVLVIVFIRGGWGGGYVIVIASVMEWATINTYTHAPSYTYICLEVGGVIICSGGGGEGLSLPTWENM